MEMIRISCLLLLLVPGCMCMKMRFDDCNPDKSMFHVDSVRIDPYPPLLPGDLTPSGHIIIGRNISGNITLDLSIRKKILWFWIHVPCISNHVLMTSACSVKNAFTKNGQTECPPQMAKQGLPCTCPIPAGSYYLNPDTWPIPKVRERDALFLAGDYKADVKLTDKDTGELIECYHVEMTFSSPCSGLSCIFG